MIRTWIMGFRILAHWHSSEFADCVYLGPQSSRSTPFLIHLQRVFVQLRLRLYLSETT